jgi:hypothetical protein
LLTQGGRDLSGKAEKVRPVTKMQIDAALGMHRRLKQWRLSDEALNTLRDKMPGWDDEASLLKSVAVNSLYGTNVLAIIKMAQHVSSVFKTAKKPFSDTLVAKIAFLDLKDGKRPRNHVSFASKLCHFFVDEERFPIYDTAACETLKYHLGRNYQVEEEQYAAFRKNIQLLTDASNITANGRELDRYLWIAGMYSRWKRSKPKSKPMVNAELLKTFRLPEAEDKSDLAILIPNG